MKKLLTYRQDILLILLLFLAANYFVGRLQPQLTILPIDFAINWTAAKGLQSGVSLYDRDSLREIGLSEIGRRMTITFSHQFSSYISPPSTAVLMLPFTALPFRISVGLFRISLFLAFAIAILLSSWALAPGDRRYGLFLGTMGFLLLDGVPISMRYGQINGWVALTLGLALWAAARGRWALTGLGIGVATLLKISPGILALYCLLRGQRITFLVASFTVLGGLAMAALLGQPSDLSVFIFRVLPITSLASIHVANQSIPAWLVRIFGPSTNFLSYPTDIGAFSLLGPAIALAGTIWVVRKMKGKEFAAQELGVLVILGLVSGPLTWDHYTAWAIVSLALLGENESWLSREPKERLGLIFLLGISILLLTLHLRVRVFAESNVLYQPELRLLSGMKTIGLILLAAVAMRLLGSHGQRRDLPEPS